MKVIEKAREVIKRNPVEATVIGLSLFGLACYTCGAAHQLKYDKSIVDSYSNGYNEAMKLIKSEDK